MDTLIHQLSQQYVYQADRALTPADEAKRLVLTVESGDLRALEKLVQTYCENVDHFVSVATIAAESFQHPNLFILPSVAQTVRMNAEARFDQVALLTISWNSPTYCKIISVCTNKRWETRVLGGPLEKGLVSYRPALDDPVILMKQIGKLACIKTPQPTPPQSTFSKPD